MMDDQETQMEAIPSYTRPNGDRKSELEDRSWYILTIVIRIGRPSLPEEISEKCKLFDVSPLEVEALCRIPESPIRITEGHMVTFSEVSIFLFRTARGKSMDPLDLVVPDSPVYSSSPSTKCSKGARLHSALRSRSLKCHTVVPQNIHPMNSPLFQMDVNKTNMPIGHEKSSCPATSLILTPLTSRWDAPTIGTAVTSTVGDNLQSFCSRSKGQSAMGNCDSLKSRRKRLGEELPSTSISFKNLTKAPKLETSIFPENFKGVEIPSPAAQYYFKHPEEEVNLEVAIGAIQGEMDMHVEDKHKYQMTLDHIAGQISDICYPKIPVILDASCVSKPEHLPVDAHTEGITKTRIDSKTRNYEIVEASKDKENGISLPMKKTLFAHGLEKPEECRIHNESDKQDLQRDASHGMLALDLKETDRLECIIRCSDDILGLKKQNSDVSLKQCDRINIELDLSADFKSVGGENRLHPKETMQLLENHQAKTDGSTRFNRQNKEELLNRSEGSDKKFMLNNDAQEIYARLTQTPEISANEFSKTILLDVGMDHVSAAGYHSVRLEEFTLSADQLATGKSEDENIVRCNNKNIIECNDAKISMRKETSPFKMEYSSKKLEASHVKGLAKTGDIASQENRDRISAKQRPKKFGKGPVVDNGGAAHAETSSSQKFVESRRIPIFESFTVEEEEGSGGYGKVYKARRKHDAQIFAIKCPLEKTPKRYVTNEIKMLERFGGKDFIIKSEGVFKNNEQDCLILKYVMHDKPEVLRREITISELCWYGFCMFKALASLHKQGIIHRDVKPGNFLFSRKNKKGYLIDFNLALDQYDSISNTSMLPPFQKTSESSVDPKGSSFNRKGSNGKSTAFSKQSMLDLRTLEAATTSQSKVASYCTKKAAEVPIKPSSVCWKNKENQTNSLKKGLQTTPVLPCGSSDIRAHRKFGQDIVNADHRNKMGESVHSKDIASGRTPSAGEAVREPMPTHGRKELLSLLQEARQNSQQQSASLPVSQRKRVAAPQQRRGRDNANILHVSPRPLNSNCNMLPHRLSGRPKNTGIQKNKRDGPCVGTKGYRAPEVLLRSVHQSPKLDVWSAGVSLLHLMIGKSPFPANSTDRAIKDIAKLRGTEEIWELSKLHDRQDSLPQDLHSVGFEHIMIHEWCKKYTKRPEFLDCIPMSLYDLVDKCLCVNPRQRINADEALQHEFFAPCHEEYKRQRSAIKQGVCHH